MDDTQDRCRLIAIGHLSDWDDLKAIPQKNFAKQASSKGKKYSIS